MSSENGVLQLAYEAAEDLSDYKYHFVVLDPTTGKVRLPDSAAEIALGILQNAPESGQPADVMIIGKSKLVANAAISKGKFVGLEYVGAADAGKGTDVTSTPYLSRAYVLSSTSNEDELLSVLLLGIQGAVLFMGKTTVTTLATVGAATYTAAQLTGGLIARDPAGAARSDVTPTGTLIGAALIAAGAGADPTGISFEFTVRNDADADETITITAGVGVTLSGTMTITQNKSRRFLCVMASATTCTIYSLGYAGTNFLIGKTTVSTIATAGAVTYTAAQLTGGLIKRDPAGGARSDITPTGTQIGAALIAAGAGADPSGRSFEFTIVNDADANETITVTAGADVTLSGTMTIAQSNAKRFLCLMNTATTATIYSLGTVVN